MLSILLSSSKVMRYKPDTKTHMLLYAGEGETVSDELEEDLIGVQGKIQGIDKWQIWEESDRCKPWRGQCLTSRSLRVTNCVSHNTQFP